MPAPTAAPPEDDTLAALTAAVVPVPASLAPLVGVLPPGLDVNGLLAAVMPVSPDAHAPSSNATRLAETPARGPWWLLAHE